MDWLRPGCTEGFVGTTTLLRSGGEVGDDVGVSCRCQAGFTDIAELGDDTVGDGLPRHEVDVRCVWLRFVAGPNREESAIGRACDGDVENRRGSECWNTSPSGHRKSNNSMSGYEPSCLAAGIDS
jgi:hypothetical protein